MSYKEAIKNYKENQFLQNIFDKNKLTQLTNLEKDFLNIYRKLHFFEHVFDENTSLRIQNEYKDRSFIYLISGDINGHSSLLCQTDLVCSQFWPIFYDAKEYKNKFLYFKNSQEGRRDCLFEVLNEDISLIAQYEKTILDIKIVKNETKTKSRIKI